MNLFVPGDLDPVEAPAFDRPTGGVCGYSQRVARFLHLKTGAQLPESLAELCRRHGCKSSFAH